ncbi:hypothetical protein ACEQPO_28705 [Bacillus sp. SL00103]
MTNKMTYRKPSLLYGKKGNNSKTFGQVILATLLIMYKQQRQRKMKQVKRKLLSGPFDQYRMKQADMLGSSNRRQIESQRTRRRLENARQ